MTQAPKSGDAVITCCRCDRPMNDCGICYNPLCKLEGILKYQRELKSMTQEEPKTMTARDAWIAMADGKYVNSAGEVYRILRGHWLQSYDGRTWRERSCFDSGPYSIVPDPSKPEQSEYEKDILTVGNQIAHAKTNEGSYGDQCLRMALQELFGLLQKHYVRKGER